MANPEHLEILQQGVEVWNQWRRKNPEIKPDLSHADLSFADLSFAHLRDADLSHAFLSETNLHQALVSLTIFAANDLSTVKGLETVNHFGPSTIGIDTLYLSGGHIPEVFLRGCVVPDEFIPFIPSHFGIQQPFRF